MKNVCAKCTKKFTCRYAEENKQDCYFCLGSRKNAQEEIKRDKKTIQKTYEDMKGYISR